VVGGLSEEKQRLNTQFIPKLRHGTTTSGFASNLIGQGAGNRPQEDQCKRTGSNLFVFHSKYGNICGRLDMG
jgi:hypothetical protein